MRRKRYSLVLTVDQLALLLVEQQQTGMDLAACIKRAVSVTYAHNRVSTEYGQAVATARHLIGPE